MLIFCLTLGVETLCLILSKYIQISFFGCLRNLVILSITPNGGFQITNYEMFPSIKFIVQKYIILNEPKVDKLILKHSSSGNLTLKDAYLLKKQRHPFISRAKSIMCTDIPRSKSLLVWRLVQRGCNISSLCTLCCNPWLHN
jgi:hypothetical protein